MKRNNPYLLAAALLAVAFTGCKNDEYDNKSPFDNVVYLNVSENSDTLIRDIGVGKQQLVEIAKALAKNAKLLILDEPFNGLDKHGVAEIRELLLELKAAGKTILLASHNEEDIRILCDHVYEMDGGILRER